MNKILGVSALIVALSVFYYLVIHKPQIDNANFQIKESQVVESQQKVDNRSQVLVQCSEYAKQYTIKYISGLQYPAKIPSSYDMIQRVTSDCMKNKGY